MEGKIGQCQGMVVYKVHGRVCGYLGTMLKVVGRLGIRATSHSRLIAHDHYITSTLIGGKGGVAPSSFHTTLERPTEYVNARWL